ncbi:exopolysaccharide Pel transporter PelG [Azonexus hydrophilus]|uniref:Exopolysaccharide Pel transporter PelG n=1 Tax=Azonexus hydrophilus TaxID=418702 RepID=A0ABZ2XND2_9RHOO
MAGIGFELRKLLRKNTFLGVLEAYAYAGVIGSGPWVFSIVGILAVGILSHGLIGDAADLVKFQTSVTYLVASSLIFTGLVQLAFTRFVSDRLFENNDAIIVPNLHGLLLIVIAVTTAVGTPLMFFVFPEETVLYRLLMLAGFVLLSAIWVVTIFLSGMKRYKAVAVLFLISYIFVVLTSVALASFGLSGLLFGFVFGHFLLLAGMWSLTIKDFDKLDVLMQFDFTNIKLIFPSLIAIGFFYNLAVWIDKIIFWYYPATSTQVIGHLRASPIYDIPVFLSYLSIIPGMAVFLVRIETDFVDYYNRFYNAVRDGGSLSYIEGMRDEMVFAIQQGLSEIFKIQGLTVLLTFVAGPSLLTMLGISHLYLPLLYIQVVGASLQVGLMAVLNVFFYLDQRRVVLILCAEFLVLNALLTAVSLYAGAAFYGYGFTVSVLITLASGLWILSRILDDLEYETFMLQ